MFRPRRFKRRTVTAGLTLLCATLALGSATPAQAQPNRYAEDWERLKKVIAFGEDALKYVNGFLGAIAWLTGLENPNSGPTLEEIRETIVEALREDDAQELVNSVSALVSDVREIRANARSRAEFLMSEGLRPEDLMRDPAGQQFLVDAMVAVARDTNHVLHTAYSILERPARSDAEGYSQEKQLVAVLPSFLALVPLRAAALTMVGQLIPSLEAGQRENITAMYHASGLALYRAVGTYAIGYDFGRDPWPLLSPVGLQHTFMYKRPLFSYYHRLPGQPARGFALPIKRFSQYQSLPLVTAALTLLDTIRSSLWWQLDRGINMIEEDPVWIYDLFRNPNDRRTSPQFRSVSDGRIIHVWACDPNGPEYDPRVHPSWTTVCPRIPTEGN